jgi:hypothetical protein
MLEGEQTAKESNAVAGSEERPQRTTSRSLNLLCSYKASYDTAGILVRNQTA